MRLPALVCSLALVALVAAGVAWADAAKRRVLVADAVANDDGAKAMTKTLTSMLVARLDARPGIDALSGAELRQLMSLQADKASCGSDESCLAELTGALGAPLAVFSDVGKLGALTVVNLTLFDVAKAEPVGRASVETAKLEELPAKLDAAVDTLLASARAHDANAAAPAAKAAAVSPNAPSAPSSPDFGAPSGRDVAGALPESASASAAEPRTIRPVDVRNAIAAHRNELKACAAIAKKKGKAGMVKVQFLIAPDGAVTFAHIAGTDLAGTGVPKCVIDLVASWTFPKTGAPTSITYPLRFE